MHCMGQFKKEKYKDLFSKFLICTVICKRRYKSKQKPFGKGIFSEWPFLIGEGRVDIKSSLCL